MGKKSKQKEAKESGEVAPAAAPKFVRSAAEIDPALASLFAASVSSNCSLRLQNMANGEQSGPTKPSNPKSRTHGDSKSHRKELAEESLSEVSVYESAEEGLENGAVSVESEAPEDQEDISMVDDVPQEVKKRKRKNKDDDLEGRYMDRLAEEEEREKVKLKEERREKRRKLSPTDDTEEGGGAAAEDQSQDSDASKDEESEEEDIVIPQHESLNAPTEAPEFEAAARTVFLGNVSSQAIASKTAKKVLITHLSSFLASLPEHKPPHAIESFRFRSTAYSNKLPKKAAFAKKELMDTTTKSTNAYVVYSTKIAAKEAAKRLNGTMVLDRHLRADEVAHPAKTDHRRCIFVGNLGFVDDASQIQAANEEEGKRKQKQREPGDVEEGLWREFGKVGKVESVRVVRDPKTRVGKGIAYVQFVVSTNSASMIAHS
jgi:nucleolar protein 12